MMPRNNAKKIRKQDLSKAVARQWEAIARGDPSMLEDFALPQTRPPRPPSQRPEAQLQKRLVTHLRKHLPAGSLVWSNNNISTNRNQRFTQIAQGLLPGLPDITILTSIMHHPFGDGRWRATTLTLFIELKSPTGRLSDTQRHVHDQLRALGVPVLGDCRSVEQAVEWLKAEGVSI